MSPRRRIHRWTALIALFGLLFQQAAMATYRCPIEQSGASHHAAPVVDVPAPCHAPATTDTADPVRCEAHCHPTVSSADHTSSLTVPPAMLGSTWTVPAVRRRLQADATEPLHSVDPHAGAPPLSVRYCSFQI